MSQPRTGFRTCETACMPALLSLAEFAARLPTPVHPTTIIRWAAKNKNFPQPFQLAGRYYFSSDDVARYLEQERAA